MSVPSESNRIILHVPNIHCGHCIRTITRELRRLPFVTSVEGSLERKEVAIEYVGDTLDQIKKTLAEIGYPAAD